MIPTFLKLSLAGASLALGATLHAQVTYLDADFGTNTSPGTALAGTVAQDNAWALREFGTNGSIFESSGNSGPEDAPELTTLITGLTPGQSYNVWVNFYDVANDGNQDWAIRGGFTSGNLTLFANGDDGGTTDLGGTAAGLASDLTYLSDPRFDDGSGRMLYAGSLGAIAANGSGEISVFVDDIPAAIGSNNRTWYDGVSYQAIPEPSTYAMIFGGLALAAAVIRRQRRR